MNIHIIPTQAICRIYPDNGAYEKYSKYDAVFTITFLWEGAALIQAGHGDISFNTYRLVSEKLEKEFNIKTIFMERHGKVVRYSSEKFNVRKK